MQEETIAFSSTDERMEHGTGCCRGRGMEDFAHLHDPDLIRRTEAIESSYAEDAARRDSACARIVDDGWHGAPAGQAGIDLSVPDYLGLASHPAVRGAALQTLDDAGAAGQAQAARLSRALETTLGTLLQAGHASLFPTGPGAAFGAITSLVHGCDHVVLDEMAQAALHQGAYASTARLAVYRHLDTCHLRELLAMIRARDARNAILVVTEGLFAATADTPDLPLTQYLCREYGATLLVDVAHDLGALGGVGTGVLGQQGMLGKVDIVAGDLANVYGGQGGFVASASHGVRRRMQRLAATRPAGGTLPPLQAAVILEALRIAGSAEGEALRARLLENALGLRAQLAEAGVRCLGKPGAIVPAWVGSEAVARMAARLLERRGVLVGTCGTAGHACLALHVTAAHTLEALRRAGSLVGEAIGRAGVALGVAPVRAPSYPARWRT